MWEGLRVNPVQAITSVFRRYFEFHGRSMRSEFWWFILFYLVVSIVIAAPAGALREDGGILYGLYGLFILASLIPYLAVAVRRLHDRNRTGWWLLLTFVPFGGFVLIYWWALPGDPGPNRYGPPPTVE